MGEMLEQAAIEVGMDPDRFRSHSLRLGGATALYHVKPDLEFVKRFGRWSSSSFHAYLWESNEQTEGLAASMAADESRLITA